MWLSVDPGVGTDRAIFVHAIGSQIYVAAREQWFARGRLGGFPAGRTIHVAVVDPNVGILARAGLEYLPRASRYHGPVAAHLSLGVSPERPGTCR